MLRSDVNYPYPVLRTEPFDYVTSVFNDEITVEIKDGTYVLTADFSVNNAQIEKMIHDGLLGYALYIRCRTTMLRKMYDISSENPVVELNAGDVHKRVDYIGYIIARSDIRNYENDDFDEDYHGVDYSLKVGDVVGVGEQQHFNALYENDLVHDATSIIEVQGSDTEKFMKIDLYKPHIMVYLPPDQSTAYKNMKDRIEKYALLHSVITIPALIEAIHAVEQYGNTEEEITQLAWFSTIQQKIEELAESMNIAEMELYEHPTRTAQIILKNNSADALKMIGSICE